MTKKLLIVDDHRLFLDSIQFILERTTDYAVAGVLHSGRGVMHFLAQYRVDMLLLDINLPDISGFDLAKTVRLAYPHLSILALSMHNDTLSIKRMMEAGATGYCIKSAGYDELLSALHQVAAGSAWWPAEYFDQLQTRKNGLDTNGLTNREADIIRLIAGGVSSRKIADELFLSMHTIETHRKNIYRKLGIHTNIELASFARQHKLL